MSLWIENINDLDIGTYKLLGKIGLEKIKKYLETFQRYFEEFVTAINHDEGLNDSHTNKLSSLLY